MIDDIEHLNEWQKKKLNKIKMNCFIELFWLRRADICIS
jgi:predicted thioredoxin/glutaredoxin